MIYAWGSCRRSPVRRKESNPSCSSLQFWSSLYIRKSRMRRPWFLIETTTDRFLYRTSIKNRGSYYIEWENFIVIDSELKSRDVSVSVFLDIFNVSFLRLFEQFLQILVKTFFTADVETGLEIVFSHAYFNIEVLELQYTAQKVTIVKVARPIQDSG